MNLYYVRASHHAYDVDRLVCVAGHPTVRVNNPNCKAKNHDVGDKHPAGMENHHVDEEESSVFVENNRLGHGEHLYALVVRRHHGVEENLVGVVEKGPHATEEGPPGNMEMAHAHPPTQLSALRLANCRGCEEAIVGTRFSVPTGTLLQEARQS